MRYINLRFTYSLTYLLTYYGHTVCGSMIYIQSETDEIRREKQRKIEQTTGQKYHVRICYAGRP